MNAIESITARKSTRAYKFKQINNDDLETILQAGMAAPVGSGAYDTLHITVVQNQNLFSKINAAVTNMIFKMMGKKMDKTIELLDCTLRDGAYIVDAKFGTPAIKGIIKKMQDANVDIIECGCLKNAPHAEETSFYHTPEDLKPYLLQRSERAPYVAMIDWDRYELDDLPE